MKAADLLTDVFKDWLISRGQTLGEFDVAALLAHGEQGVAILPDGTLRALEPGWPVGGDPVYRLVPVSAEAGDTNG